MAFDPSTATLAEEPKGRVPNLIQIQLLMNQKKNLVLDKKLVH